MSKLIYLDNAATTKTAPEVLDAMLPYFSEYYGNPSSIYDFAQKSKEAVTKGRQQIADALNTRKKIFILQQAEVRQTTGHLRLPLKHTNPKVITLLQPRSSIMLFCIHVNIWKKKEEQRSHILMWMRMELSVWMNWKKQSHRKPSLFL